MEILTLNNIDFKKIIPAPYHIFGSTVFNELNKDMCDQKNRENHDFPLRMAWEQVQKTIHVVPADFFIVYHAGHIAIAAAMVFHIHHSIVRVIYWGGLTGYNHLRPMNYLSYKLFAHYHTNGKQVVDVGPSTEESIPNRGLCRFNESIGCSVHPKLTLFKRF